MGAAIFRVSTAEFRIILDSAVEIVNRVVSNDTIDVAKNIVVTLLMMRSFFA